MLTLGPGTEKTLLSLLHVWRNLVVNERELPATSVSSISNISALLLLPFSSLLQVYITWSGA